MHTPACRTHAYCRGVWAPDLSFATGTSQVLSPAQGLRVSLALSTHLTPGCCSPLIWGPIPGAGLCTKPMWVLPPVAGWSECLCNRVGLAAAPRRSCHCQEMESSHCTTPAVLHAWGWQDWLHVPWPGLPLVPGPGGVEGPSVGQTKSHSELDLTHGTYFSHPYCKTTPLFLLVVFCHTRYPG